MKPLPSSDLFRALPSVDAVLGSAACEPLVRQHGRHRVVAAIRDGIESLRHALRAGAVPAADSLTPDALVRHAAVCLDASSQPRIRRVVNASGIILHTGLGRAVMPASAAGRLAAVTGYCNVQMDLDTGVRVRREANLRELVQMLTGAEDALLVNNNAGATLLVLAALAPHREVIISRGELIEIGGSFRLPEIMARSGAVMREVGATNKTHLRDYRDALGADTALLFKAHKSNYQIVGFTREVGIAELAELGRVHGVPVVDDLGCGALVDLEPFGLDHEMTMRESIEAGADIVLSSTDKLIGGPQGGLIVGPAALLDRIRTHPLYRALRVGKLTLAALESTLAMFAEPERLTQRHPVYAMLARTIADMQTEAATLAAAIALRRPAWQVTVIADDSHLGGGSLPGSSLPSVAVQLVAEDLSAKALARALRLAPVPVIPYVRDDAVLLNLRTIHADEFDAVLSAIDAIGTARRG